MGLVNSIRYRISLSLRALNRVRYRIANVKVGKDVFISLGAHIDTSYPGSIEIGDGTYITRGAKLVAHDHSVYRLGDMPADNGRGYIRIGKNVFVGVGSIVLRNVTVGDNAIISAGSVVGKDVPANTIVMGNPARVIKEFTPRQEL